MMHKFTARRIDDDGYTLMEMAVAISLIGTLLAIVLVVITTFMHVETDTNSNYQELNQLIPIGTSFQRLLRSAVSPATGGTGAPPVPPFGTYTSTHSLTSETPISSTSLTFFSNSGTVNGPVEVKAAVNEIGPTTYSFTVETISPTAGTCPGINATATACTWTGSPRLLFTVSDVANPLLGKPVFQYHLLPTLNDSPATVSAKHYGTPATLSAEPFTSCTATATGCPADKIQSIKVDLEVKIAGAKDKIESQTVTYQLSTVSQTYSPAVG
jgi:prepilin-type N-terminal cleavage/methylation domain-containing protein